MITPAQIETAISDPEQFIKTHELNYAHGSKNHADRSASYLIDRFFIEKKKTVSSFHTQEEYNQCVCDAIRENIPSVCKWLNSEIKTNLILQSHIKQGHSGIILYENKNGKLETMQSRGVKIVLTKSIADVGFHIVTAYPSEKQKFCSHPDENLSEAMQKTCAYRHADPFAKMYLLSISDPNLCPIPFPDKDRVLIPDCRAKLAVLLKESGAYLAKTDPDGKPVPGLFTNEHAVWGNLKHANIRKALKKRAPDLYRQSMSLMEACLPDTYAACMPSPHAADRAVRKDAELKTRVSMEKRGGHQPQEETL